MIFDLTITEIAIRLALGLAIGFCIGLSGMGGGILGLQATTFVLGLDPIKAVGTTSLYLFLTNIAASFQHYRLGNVALSSIWPILTGAIPANIAISIWISTQSDNIELKAGLENLILFIVFVAVVAMGVNMLKKTTDPDAVDGGRFKNSKKRMAVSLLFGICFGSIVGATSVGGGILLVPALILLGLSSYQTVGSAIFITMTLTFITAMIYGTGGEVDQVSAITMAVGSLAGVYFGSRCSVGIPEKRLKKIMIGIISVIALA
ncbi:MAG: sulfite exporter TauE/SafE family protein, partial [Kiritimatiellaceae bacterium]|nr:sulfite exporter TauE/SafE family protein [Kiritimatiellaceae bacterium]